MRGSGAHVRRTYAAMSRDIVDDLATVPSPDDMRRSSRRRGPNAGSPSVRSRRHGNRHCPTAAAGKTAAFAPAG